MATVWPWLESLFREIGCGTLLVFTLLCLIVLFSISIPHTDIPGPFALPLIGNLPLLFHMGKRRQQGYFRLQKKYGDVFRLFLGKAYVDNTLWRKNIQDAFVRHGMQTSNRPDWIFDHQSKIKHGILEPGIVLPNGHIWRKNHKFAIQTMRNFGMGKKSLEEVITEEAKELCADVAAYKGETMEKIKDLLSVSVSNVVHSIVFGYRCPHDDPEFLTVIGAIDTIFKAPPIPFQILPKFIQNAMRSTFDARQKAREDIGEYLETQIKDHEKIFNRNSLRDLVDQYLAEIPWGKDIKEKILMMYQVVLECFAAGSDTTATTLEWAALYMIKKQDVQEKCFKEIKNVVGLTRDVCYSDRSVLGFLEATVLETSSEDLIISGHVIPKDTIIAPFVPSVHMDPELFPDPDEFRPEKFYDEKTGNVINKDMIIPFSLGPRICPGETLARTELFTMLGNLIQKFKLSKVSDDDSPSLEPLSGIVSHPEPFRLRAEPRVS